MKEREYCRQEERKYQRHGFREREDVCVCACVCCPAARMRKGQGCSLSNIFPAALLGGGLGCLDLFRGPALK